MYFVNWISKYGPTLRLVKSDVGDFGYAEEAAVASMPPMPIELSLKDEESETCSVE